jgi:hypothetical protein
MSSKIVASTKRTLKRVLSEPTRELLPAFANAEELGRWDEAFQRSVPLELAQLAVDSLSHGIVLETTFSGIDMAHDAFSRALEILADVRRDLSWKTYNIILGCRGHCQHWKTNNLYMTAKNKTHLGGGIVDTN